MNSFRTSLRHVAGALALALAVFAGGNAVADDTEIFFGQTPNGVSGRPNILFVIDTSGSMGTNVVTQNPYDPSTVYTGACRTDRVYWVTGSASTPPACTTNQYVTAGKFFCLSAQSALANVGFSTQSPAAQWNGSSSPKRWTTLSTSRTGNETDCGADSRIDPLNTAFPHGDGSSKRYAANGSNGPYNTNAANQISWTSAPANSTYTFFSGNYVNYYFNGRITSRTRLQIVQEVVKNTLEGLTNVNVGLMRYSTDAQGGMVLAPIDDVATSLATIETEVDALTPSGATPLEETLYEAALYFRGMSVDFGARSSPVRSVATSRQAANQALYKTPILSDCQKNFIVFLTDGLPNGDIAAGAKILALPNFANSVGNSCGPKVPVDGGTANGNDVSGRCFDDLAEYLYKNDHSSSVPGVQNVTLYTIGFGSDVAGTQLLIDAARRGGGQAYDADDTASLTTVLQSIIRNILTQNTFFTSPAISVNAFNRTRNLNDLFITMFQSVGDYHWPGNLKKYRLRQNGEIVGADGAPAVDPSTGFFRGNSESFWRASGEPIDGADVSAGGAAMRQPVPADRRLYTDFATGDLTATGNLLVTTNTAITPELLGANTGDTTTRDLLVEFARGADVTDANGDGDRTDSRHEMGDPLHAQPVSVIYGGTSANPNVDDAVVFAATNDGYLHAVSPTTGEELWAFVPTELLPRMKSLYENASASFKYFGLDGSLRVYRHDKNNDGVIVAGDGDQVLLMFGMGRGGSTYYMLDITDKARPQLLYRLTPTQLPGLGQTWSTPTFARVNIAGVTQNSLQLVAVFGGGYDPTQDNVGYNTDDTGNRIYMVDALTGTLLWRAGPSAGFGYDAGANLQLAKMNNSIPADVRVLDMTGDGYADRMYASDTGGRIWRFDIWNGQAVSALVTGGVFASLGVADGTGTTPADARRFYYAPDLSLMKQDNRPFINIAIGSGFRGSPLNTQIHDRFYSLRDYAPFARIPQAIYNAWVPITDQTAGLVDTTGTDQPVLTSTSPGWKLNLNVSGSWAGEKSLAEARTFGGQVFFTTYQPLTAGANSCTVTQGQNRLYVVSALNGGIVPARESKTSDLPSAGIAANVVFVFPSPDDPDDPDSNQSAAVSCSGTGCPEVPPPRCLIGLLDCGVLPALEPMRTFWTQQRVDE